MLVVSLLLLGHVGAAVLIMMSEQQNFHILPSLLQPWGPGPPIGKARRPGVLVTAVQQQHQHHQQQQQQQ